jgi:thymidine kinase
MKNRGTLTVVYGCMFAGKTTKLIEIAKSKIQSNKHAIVFKPSIDKRYSEVSVVSHDGLSMEAVVYDELAKITVHESQPALVAFDEIQFYEPAVINYIDGLLSQGTDVVVSGLDVDFRGEPFMNVSTLLEKADEAHRLYARCVVCESPATISQRIIDGMPAKYTDPVIMVGGQETYEPRCEKCHIIGAYETVQ